MFGEKVQPKVIYPFPQSFRAFVMNYIYAGPYSSNINGCGLTVVSHMYIKRAGKMGCCSRYPSTVKQEELKWAEKGPRRSGERAYGHSAMISRSTSPANPRTHATSTNPSFVASSMPIPITLLLITTSRYRVPKFITYFILMNILPKVVLIRFGL